MTKNGGRAQKAQKAAEQKAAYEAILALKNNH